MSTWYRADKYACKIEPVEVLSETKMYVAILNPFWNKPQRVAKADEYFSTFAAARTYLLDLLNNQLSRTSRELEVLREKTGIVFMLEPPKES